MKSAKGCQNEDVITGSSMAPGEAPSNDEAKPTEWGATDEMAGWNDAPLKIKYQSAMIKLPRTPKMKSKTAQTHVCKSSMQLCGTGFYVSQAL